MPRRRRLRPALAALLVAGALAVPQSATPTATVTTAVVTPLAAAPEAATDTAADTDTAGVLAALDAAAGAAGGSIAVTVVDATGTVVLDSADATEPVDTASLVKLLVVQQLWAGDAAGTLSLTAEDRALMQAAIESSDDEAMNELWGTWDGAALVTAAAGQFGLTGTAAPAEAGQWGQATTTARDYATVLARYPATLTAADAATLTGWLQATTATAADGFDQRFGLLSPTLPTAGTAAKQGWMCCVDDVRQLHSAGVLADGTVVVLLGTFPESTGWADAAAALDAAAAAVTGL